MAEFGIHDFSNKVRNGNIIDLSQTTIKFCQLVISFVNDVMKIYDPDLLVSFVECFCDIFKHMVHLYVDAFDQDENVPASDFIIADAQFVIETLLPIVGSSIGKQTGVQIQDIVELHDR